MKRESSLRDNAVAMPLSSWTSYLSVAFFSGLVYSRLNGSYLDDDHMAIIGYPTVVDCKTTNDLFKPWQAIWNNDFWGTPMSHNTSHKSWRPMTTFTFRAGWCLHGDNVFYFHLVNTLLHVIATLLFQILCQYVIFHRRILPRRHVRRSLAWVSAMLYGIHPIHVECVSNIVGRSETLSAIFFILSIFALRWGQHIQPSLKSMSVGIMATLASLGLCVMSMISKEQGFSVVLVSAFLQTTIWSRVIPNWINIFFCCFKQKHEPPSQRRRSGPQSLAPTATVAWRMTILTIGAIFIANWRLAKNYGHVTVFTKADNGAAFAEHWTERVMTYAYYHWLQAVPLVWPQKLIHDMSFGTLKNVETIWDWRNASSFGLYGILLFLGIRSLAFVVRGPYSNTKSQQKCINAELDGLSTPASENECKDHLNTYVFHELLVSGLAFLILPFLPASNLFMTVGFTVAERVMYIPSMGFCIIFSLLYHTAGHAIVTSSSFENIEATSESNQPVVETSNVQQHHIRKVDQPSIKEDHMASSLRRLRMPRRVACEAVLVCLLTLYGLRAYVRSADWDNELRLLDAGVRAYPSNAKLYANLAIAVYAHQGDLRNSVRAADWALTLKDDIHTAYSMRGLVYKDSFAFDQAEHDFLKAIEIAPSSDASARTNFGLMRIQQALQVLHYHESGQKQGGKTSELMALRALEIGGKTASELRSNAINIGAQTMVKIESMIGDAVQYASHDARVLMTVGKLYARIGKLPMGLLFMRRAQALKFDPVMADIIMGLEQQIG